jgi:hypothetical protein
MMVCVDSVVTWKLNESTLKNKFHRFGTVCKDSGLNVGLDKCVVMKIC